jgi:hypothetical protein
MICVASIAVNPASCILSVHLEILWLMVVKNRLSAACYTAKCTLEVVQYTQEHRNRVVVRKFDVEKLNIRRSSEKENL